MPDSNPKPLPQKSGALPMSHRINFFNATFFIFLLVKIREHRTCLQHAVSGDRIPYCIGLPLYRTDARITCGLLVFARHTHCTQCTADPTLVLSLVSEGRNFHWLLIAWFLVFWLVQNYVWVRIKTLLLSIDISHVKLFGTLCIYCTRTHIDDLYVH